MHGARDDARFCQRFRHSSVARTAWHRERDQAPHALLAAREPHTGRAACFYALAALAAHTLKVGITVVFVRSFLYKTFY